MLWHYALPLVYTKQLLQDEIRKISRNSAPDVDTWIEHASALQAELDASQDFAREIKQEAEMGDKLYEAVKDDTNHVELLEREVTYNSQLIKALDVIKTVKDMLDEAEEAGMSNRILQALDILSTAWHLMDDIPASQRTKPLRVLDKRSFELKDTFHEGFSTIWARLVHFDKEATQLTIHGDIDEATDMGQAVLIMKAYKEEAKRVEAFYKEFDNMIIRPRIMFNNKGAVKSIIIQDNTVRSSDVPVDLTVKSLFLDLSSIIDFLLAHLPAEFTQQLSTILMPKLTTLLKETWLDTAVPTALEEMTGFRKTIALVQVFADKVKSVGWEGSEELYDWVESAPRLWVVKRRELSLNYTRRQLSLGVGTPREVTRTETQVITEAEKEQLGDKGEHDWDAAWDEDEEKKQSAEAVRNTSQSSVAKSMASTSNSAPTPHEKWTADMVEADRADGGEVAQDDYDAGDAWGWGDEDDGETIGADDPTPIGEPAPPPQARLNISASLDPSPPRETTREITLTERYTISSIPDAVYKTIIDIIQDAVALTREDTADNPVTAAAIGLFALPTYVLALYRAMSPYYYTAHPSGAGNMYCYNDSMYLGEQLGAYAKEYNARTDLSLRARGKVRLDGELAMISRFGKRAYGAEMAVQRTVITDLLGGAQNFLQQGGGPEDDEIAIDSVVAHIRGLSKEWKGILSRSAWAQAIGSLLYSLANKIILDVMDLPALGADEAYRVAGLIAGVVKLDDLFLPSLFEEDLTAAEAEANSVAKSKSSEEEEVPMTSQYVSNWLKLNFLSEVLQSDLKDLKYLWFESDLSLYFTAQEIVDLIELSFEMNHRTRDAIREIQGNKTPRGVVTGSV
jgi:centromere/kinetochore protein ZW10